MTTMNIDQSKDYTTLASLLDRWTSLKQRAGTGGPNDQSFVHAVKDLAGKFVGHRSVLFSANATLHADRSPDEDVEIAAQIEANQQAIKACTVALGEMTEALGMSSSRKLS